MSFRFKKGLRLNDGELYNHLLAVTGKKKCAYT